MKRIAVLIFATLILAGCGDKTPLEIIEGTWEFEERARKATMTFDTQRMIATVKYGTTEEPMPFVVVTQDKKSVTIMAQTTPTTKVKGVITVTGPDTISLSEESGQETLRRVK